MSCSYCEQGALHPLPQELDWSNKYLDGTKAKAREQNKTLIDFSDSKPQVKTEQTMDIDEVAFSKLQIGQSNPGEETLEVTKSLIPPPPVMEAPEEATEHTNGHKLLEAEKKHQGDKEKYELYDRIYMGQLSEEAETDMDMDGSMYTYFGWKQEHFKNFQSLIIKNSILLLID